VLKELCLGIREEFTDILNQDETREAFTLLNKSAGAHATQAQILQAKLRNALGSVVLFESNKERVKRSVPRVVELMDAAESIITANIMKSYPDLESGEPSVPFFLYEQVKNLTKEKKEDLLTSLIDVAQTLNNLDDSWIDGFAEAVTNIKNPNAAKLLCESCVTLLQSIENSGYSRESLNGLVEKILSLSITPLSKFLAKDNKITTINEINKNLTTLIQNFIKKISFKDFIELMQDANFIAQLSLVLQDPNNNIDAVMKMSSSILEKPSVQALRSDKNFIEALTKLTNYVKDVADYAQYVPDWLKPYLLIVPKVYVNTTVTASTFSALVDKTLTNPAVQNKLMLAAIQTENSYILPGILTAYILGKTAVNYYNYCNSYYNSASRRNVVDVDSVAHEASVQSNNQTTSTPTQQPTSPIIFSQQSGGGTVVPSQQHKK
jgi:hypothetical protein